MYYIHYSIINLDPTQLVIIIKYLHAYHKCNVMAFHDDTHKLSDRSISSLGPEVVPDMYQDK